MNRPTKLNFEPSAYGLSETDWRTILHRYAAGQGAYTLGTEFGVSSTTVYRHLKAEGIPRRTNSQAQTIYTCNHSYFEHIDTEEKAYWLGFLAADGCVKDCGDLCVMLSIKDRPHLEGLSAALGNNRPLSESRANGHPMVCLTVRSPGLCTDLSRHGVTPRKTYTLEWPVLHGVWVRHFVRGYVDGDGGFYFRRTATPCGHHRFNVTGSERFIRALQVYLMQRCRLGETKLDRRRPRVAIVSLTYGGRQQVTRIARLLYVNATVYLPRKRDAIGDLIFEAW